MIHYIINGRCRRFEDVPKGAIITEVNGKEVASFCENCGLPIYLEKDNFWCDKEGIVWHKQCRRKGKK
jgi:hypothetical protein